MRRFIYGVLVALILCSSGLVAKTYTDKTYLSARSNGMNMAMEYATWHKQMALIDNDKFMGTVQAVGFYEESTNEKDLGKYFGISNYDNGCAVEDFINIYPTHLVANFPGGHYSNEFIFHTYGTVAPQYLSLADKLTWRPDRQAYGVRLDYHQKLDKLLKGLFFKVSVPIVHVKTSLGYSSSCCTTTCASSCSSSCGASYCTKQKLQIAAGTPTGADKSLADYLTGNVCQNAYSAAKQVALCKAKIHNGNSETGVADIDFILGYNFLYKPTRHLNINVAVTIPTGNSPTGEYLFEAISGNGGHWAIGFGLDSAFQLWQDEDNSLDFVCAFNYRYLFSDTQMRTLGFCWPNATDFGTSAGKKAYYGHWLLGAKLGDTFATPMANFLTRNVKVTPGSHFEGIAQLAFNYEDWTFDLGYNLFAKEQEDVSLKGNPCCDPCGTTCSTSSCTDGWDDSTYGIADEAWNTSTAFAPSNNDTIHEGANNTIDREHLSLADCTTPSVVTHKVYGGIGYAFNKWDYPLMLGVFGSYEFATDNDCMEQWAVGGKIGITF